MTSNDSIKDTLDVIRRALEDENDLSQQNDNVLILNKKITKNLPRGPLAHSKILSGNGFKESRSTITQMCVLLPLLSGGRMHVPPAYDHLKAH